MSRKLMLEDLARSGLDTNDARRMKLKVLTKEQTYDKVGKKYISYEIPYLDINGKETGFCRIRFLELTGMAAKAKKPRRYTQPKDTPPHLYFDSKRPWNKIAKDPEKWIIITEGEKKASAGCKAGLNVIGLGGVWSFRSSKQGKLLLEDFEDIEWEGRPVWILFDNDLYENKDVKRASIELAKELHRLGAEVCFAYLPQSKEKMGLDDFLLEHSDTDVEELEFEEYSDGEATLADLNDEVAFIKETNAYFIIETKRQFTQQNLIQGYFSDRQHTIKTHNGIARVNTFKEWCAWENRRAHNNVVYSPGEEEVTDNNDYNCWKGWGCEPKRGSIKPWNMLLDHVFGKDLDFRKWFIQWLAYPIQNPGTKLYTAVILHGIKQGTGKTYVGVIMGKIYGDNYRMIGEDELHGSFNEWAVNKQFIQGEEITGSDKRRDADRLKGFITRNQIFINRKYQPPYSIKDCINYLFTSNHVDAFHLEDSDRRYAVHELESDKLPQEAVDEIKKWLNSGGAAHLHYHLLNEVNCSSFRPEAPAIESESKQRMKAYSRSEIDQWAHDLVGEPDNILVHGGVSIDRDFFTSQELVHVYESQYDRTGTSSVAMGKALGRVGLKPKPIKTKRGTKRLYCVRRIDKWHKKSDQEKAKNYDSGLIGRPNSKVTPITKYKDPKKD